MHIRRAHAADIEAIAVLAHRNKAALGFIVYPQYHQAVEDESLYIAVHEHVLAGFVLFHHRHDSQTTLHYLCVDAPYRRRGIGNMLLAQTVLCAHQAGKTCVRLHAIAGIEANAFYRAQGFILQGQFQGKKSIMNIWSLSWE